MSSGLYWNRTEFNPKAYTRVFHICPNNATFYPDLSTKYGPDNVFQGSDQAAFNYVIGLCRDDRNDLIRVYAGTYTLTATITLNKAGVTIEGVGHGSGTDTRVGANGEVILDISATDDVVALTITSAGDGCTIRNLSITGDDSSTPASTVTVGGVSCTIENCTFTGGDADAAVAAVDVNAARGVIRNCIFDDFRDAIDLGAAAYSIVEGNYIYTDNNAAIGIEASGVASNSIIRNNILWCAGGTGDTGIKIANTALAVLILNNVIHNLCNDPISKGAQTGTVNDTAVLGNKQVSQVGAAPSADMTDATSAEVIGEVQD